MKESYSPDKYWKKKSLSLEKKRKRKELSNEIKKDMSQIIPEFTPIREKELYQSLGVSEG